MVRIVDKAWGREIIFADTDLYCGKMMVFDKTGNKFSMHFHNNKDESWYVQKGSFKLRLIDTRNASITETILETGSTWRNQPLLPHQIEALEDDSVIIEVSTQDSVEDNYRVFPGDSQQ
jgi:mannose-6-phosphate isomerase-like protein (cupin superfamily)